MTYVPILLTAQSVMIIILKLFINLSWVLDALINALKDISSLSHLIINVCLYLASTFVSFASPTKLVCHVQTELLYYKVNVFKIVQFHTLHQIVL